MLRRYDSKTAALKAPSSRRRRTCQRQTIYHAKERDPANLKGNEVGADIVTRSLNVPPSDKVIPEAPGRGSAKSHPLRPHPKTTRRCSPQSTYIPRRPGHHLSLVHHQLPGADRQGALNDNASCGLIPRCTQRLPRAESRGRSEQQRSAWRARILENIIPLSTGAATRRWA
jgi:hypothetical protein